MISINNKSLLLLYLLLSSTSALTSLRRLVEDNVDMLSELGDLSCTMSMADSLESCHEAGDACVWCPLGPDNGGCVSQDLATMVNAVGIPHVHCGPQEDAAVVEADEVFFDDLTTCVTEGENESACVSTASGESFSCQWCVTKDGPSFGVCFSPDYVTEASSLVEQLAQFVDDDDLGESWDEIFDCGGADDANFDSSHSAEWMAVGSISDMECIVNGNPEDMFADVAELCAATVDFNGEPCVMVNLFGFMDVCITSTQKGVVDFVMDQLDDMGIDDPISIISGLGGEGVGPVLGGEDLGDFDLGDFDGDLGDDEIVAENINHEEQMEADEDETGQWE
eukprot:CAMPEP_0119016004 /NCGR_PEP_ID=MMETSP1176-20130426/11765_1 /TAXON_ID=265551 /ORGANISM="Synedropsis recta cf, Strain CCMP1620" /LENGTH=336 /DNA_ID=CAMNT_0006969329 /DNA_START=18 /DNA_END=1026 /DNA_ORIENTATION=+